jgi:hypothetical protein
MPARRYPLDDGREVVLTRRRFGFTVDVRLNGRHLGSATELALRKGVIFLDPDDREIQVVSVPGVPFFPQFDVYFDGRLLPNSVGDPRTARRTVLELLLLVGLYDLSAVSGLIVKGQLPTTWVDWAHTVCFALAVIVAAGVGNRGSTAGRDARNFMLLRALIGAVQSDGDGLRFTLDLGAFALYFWMKQATRTLEWIDSGAWRAGLPPRKDDLAIPDSARVSVVKEKSS